MADVVQYKLERMLDELDDLERRGLFSRQEIAEIVKKRRKFEYRLKRPSPLKQDFSAYIDYEKQLDALRRLRIKVQLKKTAVKKLKKSVSDYAGVSRILEIYRLATNRFKGDIELWFHYLDFCKQRGHGRMKKVLAQVIRFHPKVPEIWIYAAAWEFNQNLNVAAARALMQSGLRACPTSEDLWVEYLRMELTYLNKLKARKVALGEDEGTLKPNHQDADEKQWRDENNELFMPLDDGNNDDGVPGQDGEDAERVGMFREHGLNVLRTIYGGAVEALPTSFTLRTRLLEILESTDLAHSEDMRVQILDDMKKIFSEKPEYWDWLARVEAAKITSDMIKEIKPEQLNKAIQVYEEGLTSFPSATLFGLYLEFLMDVIRNKHGDGDASSLFCNTDHAIDPIAHLMIVFEKALSMGCATENLACRHVEFLLELGKSKEVKGLVEKLCTREFPKAVRLWTLRLSMEMRCAEETSPSRGKAPLRYVFELLTNVLKEVGVSGAEILWQMGLEYFRNKRRYYDKLVETSIILLAKEGGTDSGFSLSSKIVNDILERDGVQSARQMYKRFLALPHPGLALYRNCIELELNHASADDNEGLQNARKLYETALTTYDQDVSLWQDYYSMEVEKGTSETAAAVHWRARKILGSNVALLSPTES